jgi:hypothetical protein
MKRSVQLLSRYSPGSLGSLAAFSSVGQPRWEVAGTSSNERDDSPENWPVLVPGHVVDHLDKISSLEAKTRHKLFSRVISGWCSFLDNHTVPLSTSQIGRFVRVSFVAAGPNPPVRIHQLIYRTAYLQMQRHDTVSSKAISQLLCRLRMVQFKDPQSRLLLDVLVGKVNNCPDLFSEEELMDSFSFLQNQRDFSLFVPLIRALTIKLQECLDVFGASAISFMFSCLKNAKFVDVKHMYPLWKELYRGLLRVTDPFTAQDIGNIMIGMRWMDSHYDVVRQMHAFVTKKLESDSFVMDIDSVGACLTGFRSASLDHSEVRDSLSILCNSIATVKGYLNGSQLVMAIEGFQRLPGHDGLVKRALRLVVEKTPRPAKVGHSGDFSLTELRQCIMLLANKDSDYAEMAEYRLFFVRRFVENHPSGWSGLDIKTAILAYRGLNDLYYDAQLFERLRGCIIQELRAYSENYDSIAMIFSGFMGNNMVSVESRQLLSEFLRTISSSDRLTKSQVLYLMEILRFVDSSQYESHEVTELLQWFATGLCKLSEPLGETEILRCLRAVQHANAESFAVREILRVISSSLQVCPRGEFPPRLWCACLSAVGNLRGDCPEITALLESLSDLVPTGNSSNILSVKDTEFEDALTGLCSFDPRKPEVRRLWAQLANYVYLGGTTFSLEAGIRCQRIISKFGDEYPSINSIMGALRRQVRYHQKLAVDAAVGNITR